MNLADIFQNKALIAGLIAWAVAQLIKMPIDYLQTHKWNWALLLTTGGMPSSHSALVTATTLAIGLYFGFDNPTFPSAWSSRWSSPTMRRGSASRRASMPSASTCFSRSCCADILSMKGICGRLSAIHPWKSVGGILLGLFVAIIQW